jgi:hypothetical protein
MSKNDDMPVQWQDNPYSNGGIDSGRQHHWYWHQCQRRAHSPCA